MLSAEVKKHIDNARQVLVGVVPTPSAQIDQITNALIYKFMDDMDQAAIKAEGAPSFFTGDLERYAWTRIMDSRTGSQGRMNLYSEALSLFASSEKLPPFFRDIFRRAFLPYRDPEVLSLFLREIDYFSYSNLQELGDAYEYLLSIMGSQGDAGQFRTPRHIIDFIVDVVNPTKNDKILDPACGTGGFLISAYKHIVEQHDGVDEEGRINNEPSLSPDDRRVLMGNIEGYDIDPTMVRIAQVNLYLHQFKNPKIHSYNTLASEDRWGDKFDVILANPPFMSPKGGVRPHTKFSVQSSRAEVLFVDYIMSHLRPKGRAGIIVPEGIIFKTEKSHKQLRKQLVEDGLLAVISLPPGVFNPYAGVKTSILIFDNEHARKTDRILFIKIENDGFELGAQRKAIAGSQIPEATEAVNAYRRYLGDRRIDGDGFSIPEIDTSPLCQLVAKKKIAAESDYNLSGERYRTAKVTNNGKWPEVVLGDEALFIIESGGTPDSSNESYWNGDIFWATLADLPASDRITFLTSTKRTITDVGLKKSSAKVLPAESILVSTRATLGRIAVNKISLATNQGFKNIIVKDREKIDPMFVANILSSKVSELESLGSGGTYKEVSKKLFSTIKIPLPPIEVQRKIVEEIEVKQKAIDAAREVIKNLERERRYFGREVEKLDGIEKVKLGDVLGYEQPTKYVVKSDRYSDDHHVPVLTAGKTFVLGYTNETSGIYPKGDLPVIIFDDFTTATKFVDFEFKVKSSAMKILSAKDPKVADIKFIYLLMQGIQFNATTHKRYWISEYSKLEVPLPSIKVQGQILERYNKEEEAIKVNKVLIQSLESKISSVLNTF